MGVLDRQSLRGETKNLKLGKERLAMRERRLHARTERTPKNLRTSPEQDRRMLTRVGAAERRRPSRGLRDAPRRRRSSGRHGSRLLQSVDFFSDFAHGFGRVLLFLLLVPPLMLRLVLRPSELVTRVREAPTRLRATAKRVRVESRDPETVAGKAAKTGRMALWFLEEELADMRDGIPTAAEVRDDLRTGGATVLDQVAALIGLKERDGVSVRDRLGGALAMGLIMGTVGIGLFLAVFNGIEELKTSEHLELQTIDIVGLHWTAEADVLARLGAVPGDNMLELESAALGGPILDLPWVDRIEVSRDIAGRSIEVRVLEHHPALLVPGDTLSLMDDRGRLFKSWEAGEPFDLPLLTVEQGELTETARKGALEVLHALGVGRSLGDDAVSEIRWHEVEGYSLVTRGGLPVHLGHRDFTARLDRLERAVGAGRLPLDALASVDAGLRDRLVVVPRKARKARRTVKKVIESQPTPRRDRARLLHLQRLGHAPDDALFFDDSEAEL